MIKIFPIIVASMLTLWTLSPVRADKATFEPPAATNCDTRPGAAQGRSAPYVSADNRYTLKPGEKITGTGENSITVMSKTVAATYSCSCGRGGGTCKVDHGARDGVTSIGCIALECSQCALNVVTKTPVQGRPLGKTQ